jgi:hypothetical protein
VQVIHFTERATDPLLESRALGSRFVPLADGSGDTHVACLHLAAGGRIPKLPLTQARALLLVQGEVVLVSGTTMRMDLSAGVGVVLNAGDECALESRDGAILILVQGQHLEAHECAISTPRRIMGQRCPGEALPGATGRS